MIICKVCSAKNDDSEEFCRICGKYLPWHGDQIITVDTAKPQEEEKEAESSSELHLNFWQKIAIFLHVHKPPSASQTAVADSAAVGRDVGEVSTQNQTITEHSGSNKRGGQFGGYVRSKANNLLAENFDVYMASQAIKDRRQKSKSAEVVDGSGETPDSSLESKSEFSADGSDALGTKAEGNGKTDILLLDSDTGDSSAVSSKNSVTATAGTAQSETLQNGKESFVAARKPGDVTEATQPILSAAATVSEGVNSKTRQRSTALRKPDEIITAAKTKKTLEPGPEEKEETSQPGDIFCFRCDQFNSPLRVFCRRCGYELNSPVGENAAVPYQSLSWWQRHWHTDVKLVEAGGRPGRWGKIVSGAGSQGRVWRIIGRVVFGALALILLFSLVGPFAPGMQNWFVNLYHNTENSVNVTYSQVFAMGANATSSNSAHPPAYAVDDADNTWWQSANYPKKSKYPGVGARLTILFAQPDTINKIGWLGGVAGTPQAYLSEARPRVIRLTFYPSKYHVIEHLKDTQAFQQFSVNAVHTTSIVCTILKVYPSVTGHAVAITEIEFFQRV